MLRTISPAFIILVLAGAMGSCQKSESAYDLAPLTVAEGKKLFATHCLSCHSLQEDGIGPPLGGATVTLHKHQLEDFIRNPERVIASGEARAIALRDRYKQVMPSFDWLDEKSLQSILSYIHEQTITHKLTTPSLHTSENTAGFSGKLVPSIKKSGIKIQLKEIVAIPRLSYSTPDLGIVTLRPHPSGDGRIFVSDQGGVIYEISGGKAAIFMDIRDHISEFSIGPGIATGLGSFDFHPDFMRNGRIYITHAEKFRDQIPDYRISDSTMAEVQWVLSEWVVDDINARVFKGSQRELLRLHAPNFGHGAQDLSFIPGLPHSHPQYGLLYWGFGDGGSNNIKKPELGHHPKSFLGTILRIDPTGNNSKNGKYGIPADNPFVNDPDPATIREIYAYGFRNPHRIAWDERNSYRMIATDIGESNIEEINIIEKGGDYGWPKREGNFGIATTKDLKTVYHLADADKNLYKAPFTQYDHTEGFAISGGYVFAGDLETLKHKYVFGDIVNGRLFYVNMDPQLTDSTIYELSINKDGLETDLRTMTGIRRLHLRIGYDYLSKRLFVITKADGRVYLVKG